MKWDVIKAKEWMLRIGMAHCQDGLFAEGGELIYESKWGKGCNSKNNFKESLSRICWWDEELMDAAIKKLI